MKERNHQYGYIPWDELKPGDTLQVSRGYSSLVTVITRRYGWSVRSTIVNQPEGKRLIIREKEDH